MTTDEMTEYLERDGGRVPGSRYGWDSASCAPWAIAVAEIMEEASGDEIDAEVLDWAMGLVVNDHDDPEELIREHGTDTHRELLADLDN